MNDYSLYIRKEHMPHLLEALRLHRVGMEAVMDARTDLQAAQAAYDAYIEEGGGRH